MFIGFESITDDGLIEVHKKYNLKKGRDFRESVRRIQRHHITVAGSFIVGLEVDRPGVGLRIAATARQYGLDFLNLLYLTPLPGTTLWGNMEAAGSIAANRFPEDWELYTLNHPVVHHSYFSQDELIHEMQSCMDEFYSLRQVTGRVLRNVWRWCEPRLTLAGNLSYRNNRRTRHEPAIRPGLEPVAALPRIGGNGHLFAGNGKPAVRESESVG